METQDGTRFAYGDVSGQVTSETTKLTKNKDVVKNYTYDSAGNKSAFMVKVGDDTKLSLHYSYDGESKLTAVTDEQGNQVVGYTYDTDGNLSERTVSGNHLITTYTYDYQNRLTAMKNQTGSVGVISEYSSEYLANGQKSKETSETVDKDGKKSTKTATYTYDLLGRIRKETKTGSEEISYTYDSNNNRKEMTVGNKVTAYKYNKNDELLRTDTLNTDTEEDSVVIYKYDKNGNQLATVNRYEIPSDKKDNTYVNIDVTLGDNRLNENVVNHYNALNQLTQTLTKNYKVSFTYDAEGLRTSKTVNGEKTVFVWDGDQLVMELSESSKVQKRYIRGNDLVYADKDNNTEKQYYVTDLHGNVVQLTDESGAVIKTYEYDSFGNEVKPDGKDDNPFRYCGEYYDKETEEVYLRARYYQPEKGRFLTRDSYTGEEDEPLSLHLYTYCGNDGVNNIDPSGRYYQTTYVYRDSNGNVVREGKEVYVFYAHAYTDTWTGISKKERRHVGELSLDEQTENAKYIENFLMTKGLGKKKKKWSRKAIAGLIGNMIGECKMNPGQWERWKQTTGKTSGYGICQWTPSKPFFKKEKLTPSEANKMANNNPVKLLEKQLNYMWYTMTTKNSKKREWFEGMGKDTYDSPLKISAKKFITSNKSVKKLAKTFCSCYLRPAECTSRGKERARWAKKWYKEGVIVNE